MVHTKKKFLLAPVGAVALVLVMASMSYACTAFIGRFSVTGDAAGTPTVVVDGKGSRTSFVMSQCVSADRTFASDDATASGWAGYVDISTATSPQVSGCNNNASVEDRKLPACGSGDATGTESSCGGGTTTDYRTYTIRFYNSTPDINTSSQEPPLGLRVPGYSNHTTWTTDCMFETSAPTAQTLGSVTVNHTDGKLRTASGNQGTFTPGGTARFQLKGVLAGQNLNRDYTTANPSAQESAVCITDGGAYYGNQAPVTIA